MGGTQLLNDPGNYEGSDPSRLLLRARLSHTVIFDTVNRALMVHAGCDNSKQYGRH